MELDANLLEARSLERLTVIISVLVEVMMTDMVDATYNNIDSYSSRFITAPTSCMLVEC